MNSFKISLEHKGENFLLSVSAANGGVKSVSEHSINDIITNQSAIMNTVREKMSQNKDVDNTILDLSHELPMAIMNELVRLRGSIKPR